MISTPLSQSSFPPGRPAIRVLCAWCDQDIPQTKPAAAPLTATSHGICKPCALRHFGFELETMADAALCA
jgi:hypothetical protein